VVGRCSRSTDGTTDGRTEQRMADAEDGETRWTARRLRGMARLIIGGRVATFTARAGRRCSNGKKEQDGHGRATATRTGREPPTDLRRSREANEHRFRTPSVPRTRPGKTPDLASARRFPAGRLPTRARPGPPSVSLPIRCGGLAGSAFPDLIPRRRHLGRFGVDRRTALRPDLKSDGREFARRERGAWTLAGGPWDEELWGGI
jgi:hypothetical protein